MGSSTDAATDTGANDVDATPAPSGKDATVAARTDAGIGTTSDAADATAAVPDTSTADHDATVDLDGGEDASDMLDAGPDGPVLTTCGTASVDLQSDGANCGGCGHDCAGAVCSAGTCTGAFLSLLDEAYRCATDSRFVYYTSQAGGGAIRRVALDAGAVDVGTPTWPPSTGSATLVPERPYPMNIAVDPNGIYWSELGPGNWYDAGPGAIMKAGLDGHGVTVLASGRPSPNALTIDGTYVYWAEATAIEKVPLAGGAPTVLATLPAGAAVPSLAVAPSALYWTEVDTLTADGDAATSPPDQLLRVDLDGTNRITLAIADDESQQPGGVAVDGTSVYWAAPTGVFTLPLDGGAPVALYPSASNLITWSTAGAIVVDPTGVYAAGTDDAVLRLALDGSVEGRWSTGALFPASAIADTPTALYACSYSGIVRYIK
jgi:hypothetical protein